LIRLLILGSGYNTMISHLGLIRTFPRISGEKRTMKYMVVLIYINKRQPTIISHNPPLVSWRS
ncbi:hypothetical protein, partial [Klebsiella quasivariicola]|uniref:hypothetical protein n=1 Tax=Klebsiella quasivariicola TaxID=2026240 RepID=UPI001C4984C7